MRRIKVTQLLTGLAIGEMNGGAEMFAMRLCGALDPAVVELSVACLWSYGTPTERRWARELAAIGIPVTYGAPHRNQMRRDAYLGFVGSYHALRGLRPDILHTHTEWADFVGVAQRLTGVVPHMLRTCHNVMEWTFGRHWEPRMDAIYPLVYDREVAVSPAAAARLNARPVAVRLGRRAAYVPNAIEPEKVLGQLTGRDCRAELGIAPDAPLLLCVGRLSEQKGIDLLLRAMAQIRQLRPEATLLIVGNGEDREALHALHAELELGRSALFLGPRADVPDLMRCADLVISSSRWEGLPTVVLEAMLLGTPVLATDIPGSRDLIRDGENGLLVAPGDAAALAGRVLAALDDRAALRRMAERARDTADAFGIERVARTYEQIYSEIIGGEIVRGS